MELMHNEVVHITSGDLEGVYRIVLDEPQMGVVAVVRLDPDKDATPSKGGRKRLLSTKRPRKKAPPALVGNLVWLDRQQVERMDAAGQVVKAHIDLPGDFYKPLKNARSNELFEKHKTIMAKFFDFDLLRDSLLVHQGLGGIVAATIACDVRFEPSRRRSQQRLGLPFTLHCSPQGRGPRCPVWSSPAAQAWASALDQCSDGTGIRPCKLVGDTLIVCAFSQVASSTQEPEVRRVIASTVCQRDDVINVRSFVAAQRSNSRTTAFLADATVALMKCRLQPCR